MSVLRTVIICLTGVLLTTGSALAGPPLFTDDAATVEVGKAEIELNGSYTYDKATDFGVTTKRRSADAEVKITTGLYRDLGISLAIPYTISDRVVENGQMTSRASGFGDISVEMKYVIAKLAGISFAIKPSVIMPTGNSSEGLSEGGWQFGSTLIATKEFAGGRYALHANAGYERHRYRNRQVGADTRSDLWSGSFAAEAEMAKGLFLVADFGLANTAGKSTSELSGCVMAGARYEVNGHLDIFAGVKAGITEPEDDLSILYGLVFKF